MVDVILNGAGDMQLGQRSEISLDEVILPVRGRCRRAGSSTSTGQNETYTLLAPADILARIVIEILQDCRLNVSVKTLR